MEKVFLIDAFALIFRFYYAFIGRPMRNAEGVNTSAIFGFVRYLREIQQREQPDYLGVAFDPGGATFRHQLYPAYKANREETPEDIRTSVPYIKQILEAMHIPILEVEGYEADDVIGTLSRQAAEQGFEVYMVTPDKDYGQLIRPNVYLYKQRKGGSEGVEILGCEDLCAHYGIAHPLQVIDILALWGDASDNIPGVPGIGEKSAVKLLSQFDSVENLLQHTDQLKGKQRENIEASREQIVLSKRLATIEQQVPIDFKPEALKMEDPDRQQLAGLYRQLGFRTLLQEIGEEGSVAENATPTSRPTASREPDLFTASALSTTSEETATSAGATDLFSTPGYQSLETVPHTYHTVTTPEALDALVRKLAQSTAFCFDTETTGLDPFQDRLVGISLALQPHEAWYIPCTPENTPTILSQLRPVMENPHIAKIGQNLKFDLAMLFEAGSEVQGFLYATMLLHYLLHP
ncbi:MAG: 5'-3' exonuclease H3TH domain-containing protein, partial [Alistipes sp.]|nr:5'-3' exonuclease H3TH domain-containing protein [Alistipes sp.]